MYTHIFAYGISQTVLFDLYAVKKETSESVEQQMFLRLLLSCVCIRHLILKRQCMQMC